MILDLRKISENLLIYFALLPYLSFGLNRYDSQPWILIFLLFYFLVNNNLKFNLQIILWLFTIFLSLICTIVVINELILSLSTRALASYSIFFLVWYCSVEIFKKRKYLSWTRHFSLTKFTTCHFTFFRTNE